MADAAAEKKAAEEAARFIRELWGLQGAGYAVLILRYLTHFMFGRPFAWDDFLMLLATVSLRNGLVNILDGSRNQAH